MMKNIMKNKYCIIVSLKKKSFILVNRIFDINIHFSKSKRKFDLSF